MKRALALAMLLAFTLASAARGETEITFIHGWGTMEDHPVAMREIFEGFESACPEVKLNQIAMPSTVQVLSRVADMLSIGEVPDVICLSGTGEEVYSFMTEKGYAVNLSIAMAADPAFAENISPQILENWRTDDGSLYTIADVFHATGYWYNRGLLGEIGIHAEPSTWDEFIADCELICEWAAETGRELTPIELTADEVIRLIDVIVTGISEEGAELARRGALTLGDPFVAQAFRRIVKICSFANYRALDFGYRDTLANFNAGKSAFYLNGIWASSLIDEAIDACCAPFPGEDGARVYKRSALLGYVVGNSDDPETISASIEFVKYMLSNETQEKLLLITSQYPSNPTIDIAKYAELMPRFIGGITNLQNANRYIHATAKEWSDSERAKFDFLLRAVLAGRMSEDEAVEALGAI